MNVKFSGGIFNGKIVSEGGDKAAVLGDAAIGNLDGGNGGGERHGRIGVVSSTRTRRRESMAGESGGDRQLANSSLDQF